MGPAAQQEVSHAGLATHQEADVGSVEVEVAIYLPVALILFIWVFSSRIASCTPPATVPLCVWSRKPRHERFKCFQPQLSPAWFSFSMKVLLPSPQALRGPEYLHTS